MKISRRFLILSLLAALLLPSCAFRNFGLPPELAANSTVDAIRTQAVATALAALTVQAGRSAQPTDTPVPPPTIAPSPTLAALLTFPPAPTQTLPPATPKTPTARDYPTYTSTPAQTDFTCAVQEIEPAPSETVKASATFDLVVRLKNGGQKSWQPGKILFIYTSGQKMQTKTSAVVLPAQVDVDGETNFTVDMAAPDAPGVYKTTWALFTGGLYFCPVHFQVTVSR